MRFGKRFCGFVLLAALAATGCSSKQSASGFLSDYSQLQKSPRIDGAMVYVRPGLELARYDKFIVRPVGVHFAPEDEQLVIDAEKLSELTAYFHEKLVSELSKNYKVVTAPGPGVMDLAVAVTHLKKTQPLLNIHPATKLSGLGLGGASVEAEAFDAGTGQRQFAFMHTRSGSRLGIVEGLQDWAHAKEAMDFWVKALVDRLNEAHGITAKK